MSVRILTVAALLCAALTTAAVARSYPETIPLPNGFQPEGIDVRGDDFYVGSIPTGAIYRGDLRSGRGDVLVPGREGRAAIGLKVHDKRIVVAGGPTGKAFVYDARDGDDKGEFVLTEEPTFVNDVAISRGRAYFTDSINEQLYVLDRGRVKTLTLKGDLDYDENPGTFELNGIVAAGRDLIAVQSRTGLLFEIDPKSGDTDEIDLRGDQTVPNGDGLLLQGKLLYVVQNRLNRIAVVDLRERDIVRYLTDDDFDVPTTIARGGRWLWAPNARFGTQPGPDVRYDVVRVGI
jgi:hypothetical protein